MTEGPDLPVLVWGRVHCAGHKASVLHLALARVELYFLTCGFSCPNLDVVLYQLLRVSEQLCWESVCNVMLYEVLQVS